MEKKMAEKRTKKQQIINRAATKKFIMSQIEAMRPGWEVTQISAKALDQIEAFMRSKIKESIHRQPSIGKTYMEFY